jgi:hypothetical protein
MCSSLHRLLRLRDNSNTSICQTSSFIGASRSLITTRSRLLPRNNLIEKRPVSQPGSRFGTHLTFDGRSCRSSPRSSSPDTCASRCERCNKNGKSLFAQPTNRKQNNIFITPVRTTRVSPHPLPRKINTFPPPISGVAPFHSPFLNIKL